MPLHAITSVHGEAGLRERLLIEIAHFSAVDRARISDALALASRLHARDRRQREPYANHLLRVTVRIVSHYRVTDPDVACAALLHDAVEDHAEDIAPGGTRQAALAALARQFGHRTADLVAAVTNPVYASGRDEHEQYREHVAASLLASPWARVIKASDFTDYADPWIMPSPAGRAWSRRAGVRKFPAYSGLLGAQFGGSCLGLRDGESRRSRWCRRSFSRSGSGAGGGRGGEARRQMPQRFGRFSKAGVLVMRSAFPGFQARGAQMMSAAPATWLA
jgi:hypothetical protein